jgi:protein-L-isoaspartate O-methyltransferase
VTVPVDNLAWEERAAALAGRLADSGAVNDPRWRTAFEQIPRHVFVPRFYRDGHTILDSEDPASAGEWLDGVYRDNSLVVQRIAVPRVDSPVPASSSSRPSLMALMLELLEVSDESRVLEIGTATGYNAALLCHRLGADKVTSIELHPGLAAAAAQRLHELSYYPNLVVGDGAHGAPNHTPYDRILATCAVSAIPAAWIDQLAPGGRIVTDLRGEMSSSLAVLDKITSDTIEGRLLDQLGLFMWLRPAPDSPLLDPQQFSYVIDLDDADTTHTHLDPRLLDDPGPRALLAILEPTLSTARTQRCDTTTWVLNAYGGCWAEVTGQTVTQGGPRHLWPLIERAVAQWRRLGKPERGTYGLTATSAGLHQYWVDAPSGRLLVCAPVGSVT